MNTATHSPAFAVPELLTEEEMNHQLECFTFTRAALPRSFPLLRRLLNRCSKQGFMKKEASDAHILEELGFEDIEDARKVYANDPDAQAFIHDAGFKQYMLIPRNCMVMNREGEVFRLTFMLQDEAKNWEEQAKALDLGDADDIKFPAGHWLCFGKLTGIMTRLDDPGNMVGFVNFSVGFIHCDDFASGASHASLSLEMLQLDKSCQGMGLGFEMTDAVCNIFFVNMSNLSSLASRRREKGHSELMLTIHAQAATSGGWTMCCIATGSFGILVEALNEKVMELEDFDILHAPSISFVLDDHMDFT